MNIIIKKIIKTKCVYTVAWLTLIVVVILSIFVRNPLGFADEHIHYIKAVGVSRGQFLSVNGANQGELGQLIPPANNNYVNYFLDTLDEVEPINNEWLLDEINTERPSRNEEQFVNSTSAAPYTPLPYVGAALGSAVARALEVNVELEVVLMRLGSAIFSIVLIWLAFKIAPKKYKWTILAVALIPQSIASFAAISTDGFTIAAALLFMATLLRIIHSAIAKTVNNKEIIYLGLASLLVIGAKMPLFLLVGLIIPLIVIFKKSFSKKQKMLLWTIFSICVILTLLWAAYAANINTGAYWGRDVSTFGQLKFIINNVVIYTANLGFSILSYPFNDITYGMYANHPKYGTMPFLVDILLIWGLAMSAFLQSDEKKPTKKQIQFYWWQLILFILSVIAIFTLLYLQFTTVGERWKIEGVQPRYFVLFIPLLIMTPFKIKISKNVKILAYAAPFIGVAIYSLFIIAQLAGLK